VLVSLYASNDGDPIKPLPPSPPMTDAVEPDASLECGFHRAFSNTSTLRNSARQYLSSSLSSPSTLQNQEKAIFQKRDMTGVDGGEGRFGEWMGNKE